MNASMWSSSMRSSQDSCFVRGAWLARSPCPSIRLSLLHVGVQRYGVRAETLHPCPFPGVAVEVDLFQQSLRRGDGRMRHSTTTNRQEHPYMYLPAPADNHSAIAHHHPQCQHHLKMKLPTAPPLALAPVPEPATRSGDTSEVPQLRASRQCRHLQLADSWARGAHFKICLEPHDISVQFTAF